MAMVPLQPLPPIEHLGRCALAEPAQYTSVRLQVERITASATPACCRKVRNAASNRSSPNATFSRRATGAVLWLMPRMLNAIAALLDRNPLILVEEVPLYQA